MIEGLFQPMHLFVILIIVLIVFGPGKLPEIGSAVGKSIREFRQSTKDDEPKKTDDVAAASASATPPAGTTSSTTKTTS